MTHGRVLRENARMLSAMDDYPIHQIAEPVRFVGASDRNFYDRYYFNLHGSSDELFMVMGMGQYPNLAVQDAFAVVRRGDLHRVVRASKVLGDRMDTTVGPFRVEVVEPLKRLRFVLEPNEHGLACDLHWTGAIDAFLEPRQFVRKYGRVLFDTQRLAQTGCWSGTITIGDETIRVTPDRWKGTRDRSWGVRPVGEVEHPGIRQGEGQLSGMWNYAPMQFDDFTILYIVNEENDGQRRMEEAIRIWADPAREPEHLGRPEHRHVLRKGTRMIEQGVLAFPHAPGGGFEVQIEHLTHCYVAVGTGYGIDPDWRHGMYQGPLVVQGVDRSMAELDAYGWLAIVDHAARFRIGDRVGYGLHEHGFFGPYERYGMKEHGDGAA